MHLVLATREDPPLPLARLRGRDDLLELRAADLRFTQEEAASFLIEVMKLPLSQEEQVEIASLVRAAPVFPSDQLTTREHEVLQLLLNGAANREIAHHFVLSMNTVKRHVLNICRKFDVRSRAQVIAKMRTLHLH